MKAKKYYLPLSGDEPERKNPVWNRVTFYNCEVVNIKTEQFSTGKRLQVDVIAHYTEKHLSDEDKKHHQKLALVAWDNDSIGKSVIGRLKIGDYITVQAIMSFFEGKQVAGKPTEWHTSFAIVPNSGFDSSKSESDDNFRLMVIRRPETEVKAQSTSPKAGPMTGQEIIAKMLG